MKKILIFTDYFLPGYRAGGPVSSIANLVRLIEDEFEIIIATRNHDFGSEEKYDLKSDEIIEYQGYKIIYLSAVNTSNVKKIIVELSPDIIYLNSLFSKFSRIILSLSFFKSIKNIIILAPRGELQKNALHIKEFKKSIFLKIFKFLKIAKNIEFHSTDNTESTEIQNVFSKQPLSTLPNVPKIIVHEPIVKTNNELKILFLSRIRDNKNLYFALEILKNIDDCNMILDIYGPIEDEKYWLKCKDLIEKLPRNIKAEYKGMILPENISNVISHYHTLFLPTKTENFGHVIVEAMLTGLVPIISNQTPWLNLEYEKAGWDIPLDNKIKYEEVVKKLYHMEEKEFTSLSYSTAKFINKKLEIDTLKQKYIEFFSQASEIRDPHETTL
jgi:glycosyltransferase involved in cell wall biosynthesis